MDYKKLHKDTITKLQEMVNSGKITVEVARGICADFVPESEDERIRKHLISLFENFVTLGVTNECETTDIKVDNILAWLKKQGEKGTNRNEREIPFSEQNFANSAKTCKDEQIPKFRVGDTIKCKYDDRQFTIKSVDLDKGTYAYTQEGCGNDIDYADEDFELVEQKPAEWRIEDEQNLNAALGYIDDEYLRRWLKDVIYNKYEKPAWSEEDETGLTNTIIMLKEGASLHFNKKDIAKAVNWLKSLKDRMKEESLC